MSKSQTRERTLNQKIYFIFNGNRSSDNITIKIF